LNPGPGLGAAGAGLAGATGPAAGAVPGAWVAGAFVMVPVPVCGALVVADTEVVVVVDSFSDVLPPQPAAKIVATTATMTASDRICRSDVVVKNLWG